MASVNFKSTVHLSLTPCATTNRPTGTLHTLYRYIILNYILMFLYISLLVLFCPLLSSFMDTISYCINILILCFKCAYVEILLICNFHPSHARNCATTIISKFILNNFAEVLAVRAHGRLHGDGCLAEFDT